jgi:hypothetical protein
MNPAVYVLDTHIVAWFALGLLKKLNPAAVWTLFDRKARIVIPSYVLQEIRNKFPYLNMRKNHDIPIPPTALLRLLQRCSNARILPRGEAILAKEFSLTLMLSQRQIDIAAQDIPIAAAVLVAKDYYGGPIILITSDAKLEKWALSVGVPVRPAYLARLRN